MDPAGFCLMSGFKLALAQYPITYHQSFSHWKVHTETWVRQAVDHGAQVLVFPEYGSMELCSLFPKDVQQNLNAQIAELSKIQKDFKSVFSELAKKFKLYILAPTLPVQENSKAINRAYFFNPEGADNFQDKINMTRFEEEEWSISEGVLELKVFETTYGNIGINICFDSEFPQLAFEQAQMGMQLLLTPSCTATAAGLQRVHVGCQARALENQIYVGQCSTVGDAVWSPAVDINIGRSMVFTPPDEGFPSKGNIAEGELNTAQWVYANIDFQLIENVRKNGNVFNFKKSVNSMVHNRKFFVNRIKF